MPAADVVARDTIAPLSSEILSMDSALREALTQGMSVRGGVALVDQSDFRLPYRRYLAYEVHPDVRYVVGIYRSSRGFVVSVGENPWERAGAVHLGHLCEGFGGGGRRSTAGVPARTLPEAKSIASAIAERLAYVAPERLAR